MDNSNICYRLIPRAPDASAACHEGRRNALAGRHQVRVRHRGGLRASTTDILKAADAPRGSLYHHFPGGKQQIVLEAIALTGEVVASRLETIVAAADDPEEAARTFVEEWADVLGRSGWVAGCPVTTALLELSSDDPVREACAAVFDRWIEVLAHHIAGEGTPREEDRTTATMVLALVEGALILSRARQDPSPLQAAVPAVRRLLGP